VNDRIRNHKKPETLPEKRLLAAKHYFVGLVDSDITDPAMLNDLDDWTCIHAQVTTGRTPSVRVGCLNAVFAELLKDVFEQIKPSRATIRLDLPAFGFDPLVPMGEVNRRGLPAMVRGTAFGKAIDEESESSGEPSCSATYRIPIPIQDLQRCCASVSEFAPES
jgi:hypothetical protein